MKKHIKLNNETFEIKKVKGELHPISSVRVLSECYVRPSVTKREIYEYWWNWYNGMNVRSSEFEVSNLTIDSYNCTMFTLKMNIYKSGIFIGQLYITKTRQEFWTI